MERRQFLQKAAIGSVAAVTAGSLIHAPAVHAKKQIRWKMVTTWPPKLPYLQDAAELLAKKVEIMSDGQFKIKVFAGGELVPPLQTFDAVQKGTTVQAGSGAGYTLLYDQHVRVDVIYQRLSKRGQAWINVLGCLFFADKEKDVR